MALRSQLLDRGRAARLAGELGGGGFVGGGFGGGFFVKWLDGIGRGCGGGGGGPAGNPLGRVRAGDLGAVRRAGWPRRRS